MDLGLEVKPIVCCSPKMRRLSSNNLCLPLYYIYIVQKYWATCLCYVNVNLPPSLYSSQHIVVLEGLEGFLKEFLPSMKSV